MSVLAGVAEDVARVDIMQPLSVTEGDGLLQRLYRRRREMAEVVVGVEGGDVPGGLRPQLVPYPAGDGGQLLIVVVHGRDDVGDDLDVHVPAGAGVLGRFEDVPPLEDLGEVAVEIVGEAFDVDAEGIEVGADEVERFRGAEAVGDEDGVEPASAWRGGRSRGRTPARWRVRCR